MSLTFYILDVFAEEQYAGNQLAVVRGGSDLPDEMLLKITREMNYSETTFILSDEERDDGYDVRIFTPGGEVPFAGHPTLGTAFVIQHEILPEPVENITLNLEAGKIPVEFGDILWMRQIPPTFGEKYDLVRTATALSLETSDFDDRYPVQKVSTGLPAIIAPLKSLAALKRCRVNRELYRELAGARTNLYVFCPEPHAANGGDFSARMFTDDLGVSEDPATGSAAGCLAAYLVRHRCLDTDSIDVRVEQGYEIQRPSMLYLRAAYDEDEIAISVGGKVRMVARGELV